MQSKLYRDTRNANPTLYLDGKTCAIPSLHRDKFRAKVPGPNPVRRQVTPTNFIAGPLGVIRVMCHRDNEHIRINKILHCS